jgi:molybdate-binding protein
MNERILDLAIQAKDWAYADHDGYTAQMLFEQKFAELIVRECADITSGLSKLYPRTDVAFDVGYTMGTTRATKEIKQHFGVEE